MRNQTLGNEVSCSEHRPELLDLDFHTMACKNLAGMYRAPSMALGSLVPKFSLYSTVQLTLTLTTRERPTCPWAGLHNDGFGKQGIMFRTLP